MTQPPTAASPTPTPTEGADAGLRLQYSAISDVGRVRKDNQDSGYAGPWLLTVCDGVGGAARGDIASSTAVQQLRRLDEQPPDEDLLALVAGSLHRAHDRISELVEHDPSLSGTSTTATVALFDGHRIGIGHLGDSRGYLLREGALRQLTSDHTFVQTLIDEGRITEEDARTHPHRNLILKALDGVHETDPDLFYVDLAAGDRLLLCSDGASGVLDDQRLTDILSTGSPDFAAIELVRAALEAGSSDNVTCLVADVVPAETPLDEDLQPLLVGAAAELPRKLLRGSRSITPKPGALFRGHRAGDTGELEPVTDFPEAAGGFAIETDPIDPEQARYAPVQRPRHVWLRRGLATLTLVGLLGTGVGIAQWWIQQQYYVGQQDGVVTIFRGVNADVLGRQLSTPYESTNLTVSQLSSIDAKSVTEGLDSGTLDEARQTVTNLYDQSSAAGGQ
ncbi:MAG: protein phosphatase 2C domain-containing protein [Nocardioides sp.]|uniref:PP2C family protein-serine/threonine phosphatase n=1 Tax=Nocardioides sp. TaxID=35761 RepID=UPI0039E2CAF2